MGEFAYTYFSDLKDYVLKEMHQGGFGIFVDAWYLCSFFSMDYNPESSFPEKGKKAIEANFKSSREACVVSIFKQRYPVFLMVHNNQDVAVRLSTLDKWSRAGTFGNCHELERELKNTRT